MKRFFILYFICSFCFFIETPAQIYTCKSGMVSFLSEATIQNIAASSTNVMCLVNLATKEVAVVIPIRSFKFKQRLMEEHFNEKYMESDDYPTATFTGKLDQDIDFSNDVTLLATGKGKLKIHGVEKEIEAAGAFTVKNGDISFVSEFSVDAEDYNIKIPKVVFENISKTISVKVNISLKPYKSENKITQKL